MKEYTLIIKLQVEDPENSKVFKNVEETISTGEALRLLCFGDIITTEVKLEENADNIQV